MSKSGDNNDTYDTKGGKLPKGVPNAALDALNDSGANFWGDIDFARITPTTLGMSAFGSFVKAAIADPTAMNDAIKGGGKHDNPNYVGAVGQNSATGGNANVFWAYTGSAGLHLEAGTGYLSTASGNGGFTLDVGLDGSWNLQFAGTGQKIFWDAKDQLGSGATVTAPPAGNTLVTATLAPKNFFNATAGHITVDGTGGAAPVAAFDTIQGGVGDYMIGGSLGHAMAPAGNAGNCAIYTASASPVLVDMQNGSGYGGNAEGNAYSNMNQVRGSLHSNVLIGSAGGTDLKSGGANSVLISTGGTGYELRPDGNNTTLISTVGADRVLFDPGHGWALGETTTLLGFNPLHGILLDLSLISNAFHTATSTGNVNDYVQLLDGVAGEKVMFSPTGTVGTTGVDILDLPLVHGYTAQGLISTHNLAI